MTDQQKKDPVVNAETGLSGKQANSVKLPSMKWQLLGEAKDPEFKTEYFLYGKDSAGQVVFAVGTLKEKVSQEDGAFIFSFKVDGGGDAVIKFFTHYALCVKPIE